MPLFALGLACAAPPIAALAPPTAPVQADPCADVEAVTDALSRSVASLHTHARDQYPASAEAIREALACTPADPSRRVELELRRAEVLKAMGDELIADVPPAERGPDPLSPAVNLLVEAHRAYLHVAEHTEDSALASTAATLQLDALRHAFGLDLDPISGTTRPKSCKTNSEGNCVYRDKKRKKTATPDPPKSTLDPEHELKLELLPAYETYEHHAAGLDAQRLRDVRYAHASLLFELERYEPALPLLEDFVIDYDGHVTASWAALLLLDVLTIRWHSSNAGYTDRLARGERLLAWLNRFPRLTLWSAEEVRSLRQATPSLRAGVMWKRAMAHTYDVHDDPTSDGYRQCAAGFIEIFNTFEDHDRADTLLWNAADCYDAARQTGMAIQTRKRLLARFPDSSHAQDTLYYLAQSEQSVALYRDAAAHYLEFTDKYSKNSRAADAVANAYELAVSVGDEPMAAEAAERHEAMFKRKDPVKAAQINWATRPDEPRALAKHAQALLDTYKHMWVAGSLEAEETLGELAWDRACRDRLQDGLCVVKTAPRTSSACRLRDTAPPKIRPRKTKRADEARIHFRRVNKWPRDRLKVQAPFDEARAARAQAAATFFTLEAELEAYLAAGPDAADALTQAQRLDQAYLEIDDPLAPEVCLRAHARRALIWEMLANAHLVRTQPAAACVPKDADAQALIDRTIAAYAACVELATSTQSFDATARGCEAALTQLASAQAPALSEWVPDPRPPGASSIRSVRVQPPPGHIDAPDDQASGEPYYQQR